MFAWLDSCFHLPVSGPGVLVATEGGAGVVEARPSWLTCEEGEPVTAQLRLVRGQTAEPPSQPAVPWRFQEQCVDAYVLSWVARGCSPVTVDNDARVLERMLTALGRPAWDVTVEDVDQVVGGMGTSTAGRRRRAGTM